MAESVNGILKDEFDLDAVFPTITAAQHAVAHAVQICNAVRTHWSLELQTPYAVFHQAAAPTQRAFPVWTEFRTGHSRRSMSFFRVLCCSMSAPTWYSRASLCDHILRHAARCSLAVQHASAPVPVSLERQVGTDIPEAYMKACHLSYRDNALGRSVQEDT